MNEPTIVAIMYDFDKTLSTTDMQNYTFIPNLGMSPEEFWGITGKLTEKESVERILSYMFVMLNEAKKKNIKVTREYLRSCGKNIQFFPGVTTWFKRINDYGKSKGIKIEHYLVSSGTIEIVEGCSIYPEFTKAFGCEYLYDKFGEAIWPKRAINYTQKTQFFFRITKGATDLKDDNAVNEKSEKLRILPKNIIYLGDGMTDIACMTLIKKSGGRSIAVYPKGKDDEKVKQIFKDGRVSFICPADYSIGSKMEKMIKYIIDSTAIQREFEKEIVKLVHK